MPESLDPAPAQGSDRELVARIAAGDRSALEQVYFRHRNGLLNIAFHLLGERGAAEDVVQDVFVGLARCARRLRLDRGLRAYLVAASLNRARDLRRGQRPASLAAEVVTNASPMAAVSQSERAQAVAMALAGLPLDQREVVVLHLFEGMRFRQIAALLGASINTVKSRYRYALGALRQRLARQGVEP